MYSYKLNFFVITDIIFAFGIFLTALLLISTFYFERIKKIRIILFFAFIVIVLSMIGRSRYFMLLYFMIQYLYLFYDIKWQKFRGLKLNLGDLIFIIVSLISIIKADMVIKFFLSGHFDL